MTDTNQTSTTPAVPPILLMLIHDYSQKLLTVAAVWAVTHGSGQLLDVISQVSGKNDDMLISSVVQIGVGAAAFVASCAWTLAVAYLRKKKMTALLDFIPTDKVPDNVK